MKSSKLKKNVALSYLGSCQSCKSQIYEIFFALFCFIFFIASSLSIYIKIEMREHTNTHMNVRSIHYVVHSMLVLCSNFYIILLSLLGFLCLSFVYFPDFFFLCKVEIEPSILILSIFGFVKTYTHVIIFAYIL